MLIAPFFVINTAWVCAGIYYSLSPSIFEQLSNKTVLILCVGIVFYNLGLLLIEIACRANNFYSKLEEKNARNFKENQIKIVKSKIIMTSLELVLIIFLFTALFFLLRNTFVTGMSIGNLRQIFLELWSESNPNTLVFGILVNVLTFFYTHKLSLYIKNNIKISIKDVFLPLLVLTLSFSRTLILISLCTILIAGVLCRGWGLRRIVSLFCVFIFLFLLLALILNKSQISDNASYVVPMLTELQVYLFGGVSGFNQVVLGVLPQYNAYLTFPRLFYHCLDPIFSFSFQQSPSYYDFVETPLPLNVFTYLYPPYHDFGIIGVIIFPLVYGMFHQVTYIKARSSKSLISILFLGLFTYSAIISLFDDQYLRSLPVVIIGFVVFFLLNNIFYKRLVLR